MALLIALASLTAIGWVSFSGGATGRASKAEQASRRAQHRASELDARLQTAIDGAARYLSRQCRKDGSFVYRVSMDPSVEVRPEYNILRHAGVIYALAQYYRRDPDDEIAVCVARAARFLRREGLGPVPGEDELLAVWSNPALIRTGEPWRAKLGGAALALVALLEAERAGIEAAPIDELRALGRFIAFMQKQDGSFYSNYVPALGGRYDEWESPFYPGEAALGLLMLYERDPQPAWLDSAHDALSYLARSREGKSHVEADNWALIATERLLSAYGRNQASPERELLLRHVAQICQSVLRARPRYSSTHIAYGALTPDGRPARTAARLEGLLAAYQTLPGEYAALKQEIASSIRSGIEFLVRAQVWESPHEGGVPRVIEKFPALRASKGSDPSWDPAEIRIDFVQHALSAMLGFSGSALQATPHRAWVSRSPG